MYRCTESESSSFIFIFVSYRIEYLDFFCHIESILNILYRNSTRNFLVCVLCCVSVIAPNQLLNNFLVFVLILSKCAIQIGFKIKYSGYTVFNFKLKLLLFDFITGSSFLLFIVKSQPTWPPGQLQAWWTLRLPLTLHHPTWYTMSHKVFRIWHSMVTIKPRYMMHDLFCNYFIILNFRYISLNNIAL